MSQLKSMVLGWVALLMTAAPALAAENVLHVGLGALSFNGGHPYQGITLPSITLHQAVYDTLTTIGEKGEVMPSLAVSWKPFTNSKPSAISSAKPREAKAAKAIGSPTEAVS